MQSGILVTDNTSVQIEKDRSKAIMQTIDILTESDILLIAGKGHETYQDIAGEKIPYSDEGVLLGLGYQPNSQTNKQIKEVLS